MPAAGVWGCVTAAAAAATADSLAVGPAEVQHSTASLTVPLSCQPGFRTCISGAASVPPLLLLLMVLVVVTAAALPGLTLLRNCGELVRGAHASAAVVAAVGSGCCCCCFCCHAACWATRDRAADSDTVQFFLGATWPLLLLASVKPDWLALLLLLTAEPWASAPSCCALEVSWPQNAELSAGAAPAPKGVCWCSAADSRRLLRPAQAVAARAAAARP